MATSGALHIVGRYDIEGEVELEGSAQSLRELASYLGFGTTTHTYALHVPQNASPSPYDMFLTLLRVIQGEGSVQIDVEEDVLVINGPQQKLGILGDVIRGLADEPDPSTGVQHHRHVEYYPDHFYLASSSIPLVISVGNPHDDEL